MCPVVSLRRYFWCIPFRHLLSRSMHKTMKNSGRLPLWGTPFRLSHYRSLSRSSREQKFQDPTWQSKALGIFNAKWVFDRLKHPLGIKTAVLRMSLCLWLIVVFGHACSQTLFAGATVPSWFSAKRSILVTSPCITRVIHCVVSLQKFNLQTISLNFQYMGCL